MRKFKSGRLVRDKIIEGIFKSGNKVKYRTLDGNEYIEELKKKLSEEAREITQASDEKEIIKEIVDLQETLDSLTEALGTTKKEVKKSQRRKNQKAGSFKKKLFVEEVEVSESSGWLQYYLSRPELFPEIKK